MIKYACIPTRKAPLKKVPIIINPISGHGIGMKLLPRIEAGLRELGFEPEVHVTRHQGDGRQAAADAPDDCPYVVCLGGDGTLNEVLNGVVPRPIPIAIFPTGTGNVFCKEIGLRCDVDCFLSLFKDGIVRSFDVGRADGRTFISVSGAGFNAEVVRRMRRTHRGNMRMYEYVIPMFHTYFTYPFPTIKIEVDGEVVMEDSFLVEVGNTASYGGPMQFTIHAQPDDGYLDVCAFRKTAHIKIFKHLLGTILRLHLRYSDVAYFRGKTIKLSSSETVPTHVDGDENGSLPTVYTVMPLAAKVLVPRPKA